MAGMQDSTGTLTEAHHTTVGCTMTADGTAPDYRWSAKASQAGTGVDSRTTVHFVKGPGMVSMSV